MEWDALAAMVRREVLGTLGCDVVYQPKGGAPVTVRAVHRGPHEAMRFDPIEISTTSPSLLVDLAQLGVAPKKGDTVVIGTDTWRVTDVQPDGEGGALLSIAR